MELKMYQLGALDAFSRWLEALNEAQSASEVSIETLEQAGVNIPAEVRNYPKTAWQNLKENSGVADGQDEYVDRTDDVNRPIPHICFKVPTGGGKTLSRRRRFGTPQSANRVDLVDCTARGYLRANESRLVESGTPVSPNVGAGECRLRQSAGKG